MNHTPPPSYPIPASDPRARPDPRVPVPSPIRLACPLPRTDRSRVQLAHGGGGTRTQELLEQVFLPAFDSEELWRRHDGALLELQGAPLAFTTDSFVVRPLFFPGGNIGSLAIHGTVNDLAMCGATPRYLSAAFILEEGFALAELRQIVDTMRREAERAGVTLVTGDTKVVDRGKGDGVYVNTTGLGLRRAGVEVHPGRVQPGDAVVISGDLGRHGIAILSAREGLEFECPIESDCAPLHHMVADLFEAGLDVHCLRDLTRGGLASALVEIAGSRGCPIHLEEARIPVDETVAGACEILGLDPLYVANEGRLALFLPAAQADRAVEVLRRHPAGAGACRIGHVQDPATDAAAPAVTMDSRIGARRVVDMLSGEQLPRIC